MVVSLRRWRIITSRYSVAALEGLIAQQGVELVDDVIDGDVCGFYDDENRVIVVDSRLSYRQRRCVLMHELWHASLHDTRSFGVFAVKDEQRARRLTARTLISMDEYCRVEHMFQGDKWLMCEELDVTLQVLEDFQQFLVCPQPGLILAAAD